MSHLDSNRNLLLAGPIHGGHPFLPDVWRPAHPGLSGQLHGALADHSVLQLADAQRKVNDDLLVSGLQSAWLRAQFALVRPVDSGTAVLALSVLLCW